MRRCAVLLVLFLTLAGAVISVAAQESATITLLFRDMEMHVGQAFDVRIIDETSGREIDRMSVPQIPGATFDLEIAVPVGGTYLIDFFADVNGNGRYDAPPVDHAWRLRLADVEESQTLSFTHTLEFTDIAWPPLIDGRIEEGEYLHSLTESATGIILYWQNDSTTLHIGLASPGTGWVAIGLEPQQRMLGANIIIAAVAADGLVIEDHYGSGQTSHREDAASTIIDAAGVEENGTTTVEFAIPLSGGGNNADLEPGQLLSIILAYHRTSDSLTSRHSRRASVEIELDG